MTKLTCFSRAAVTVNDELPTSNLPACRPAMIVSKVAFTSTHLTPMTAPRAALKSASMPTIVVPLAATNSSGG